MGAIIPPAIDFVQEGIMRKNPVGALGKIGAGYTGYNFLHPEAGFRWDRFARYWGTLAMGVGISWAASKFKVNRYLPKGFNI